MAVRRLLARKAEGVVALLALEDGEARLAAARATSAASVRIASQVRCLIEADPAHPPSIEDMASLLSVGRARLCAVFKQETGESIGSFAARKRMELACALLSDAGLPIARVAQLAGYRHQSSFAEAFKRETGLSPREWRAGELGVR